jgi:hypothetical protein
MDCGLTTSPVTDLEDIDAVIAALEALRVTVLEPEEWPSDSDTQSDSEKRPPQREEWTGEWDDGDDENRDREPEYEGSDVKDSE